MLLTTDQSLCKANQKQIVSKDRKESRKHIAYNPDQAYQVRHYRLDGNIVRQTKCCDFLLINDTLKNAYFIELKGGNVDEAVPQLERGYGLFHSELAGYQYYFRIVPSRVRTHDIKKTAFRKFKDKWGSHLQYKSIQMEETL